MKKVKGGVMEANVKASVRRCLSVAMSMLLVVFLVLTAMYTKQWYRGRRGWPWQTKGVQRRW